MAQYDWFRQGRLKDTGEAVYRNKRTGEWAREADHKRLVTIKRPEPGDLVNAVE